MLHRVDVAEVLGRREAERPSLPTIVFDHVSQLYDVLALLVLLAGLKRMLLHNTAKTGIYRFSPLKDETHIIGLLCPVIHNGHIRRRKRSRGWVGGETEGEMKVKRGREEELSLIHI